MLPVPASVVIHLIGAAIAAAGAVSSSRRYQWAPISVIAGTGVGIVGLAVVVPRSRTRTPTTPRWVFFGLVAGFVTVAAGLGPRRSSLRRGEASTDRLD
jgi:hypothetical protein